MIAPWAFTNADGTRKSAKPPNTRNLSSGFFRGRDEWKDGAETVEQIRVSFPTFPHLGVSDGLMGGKFIGNRNLREEGEEEGEGRNVR